MKLEIHRKEKESMTAVPLSQHIFQTNVLLVKIQDATLFLHQTLKQLLSLKLTEHQQQQPQQNDEGTSRPLAPIIRSLCMSMQNDEVSQTTFTNAIQQKFPFLEDQCNLLLTLHSSFMEPYGQRQAQEGYIPNFWIRLYQHFMTLSFIHPQFFLQFDEAGKLYPLQKTVSILSESWNEFIMKQITLCIEVPLTAEVLEHHAQTQSYPPHHNNHIHEMASTVDSMQYSDHPDDIPPSEIPPSVTFSRMSLPSTTQPPPHHTPLQTPLQTPSQTPQRISQPYYNNNKKRVVIPRRGKNGTVTPTRRR